MPVIQASGGGGLVQIVAQTLSGAGTFDVQNISQGYNDLLVILIARGARVANTDQCRVTVNNDSATNYDVALMTTQGGATSGSTATAGTSGYLDAGQLPAASQNAGRFAYYEIRIPGYTNTSRFKGLICVGTENPSTSTAGSTSAVTWLSTAAINRISFFGATTANLAAGSELRIYGIK